MKKFTKLTALLLSLLLTLGVAACAAPAVQETPAPAPEESESPEKEGFIVGTYEGGGIGMCGSIWLKATFTEEAATDIEVACHFETAGIGASALPKHIKEVLVEQSADDIDCISGATATYNGFMTAIKACFDQARGLAVEKEAATEDETVEADVVVVGSGFAGMMAAVSAALKAQVEECNGCCAAGVDGQFGKPAERTGLIFDPNREHDYDIGTIEQTFTLLNPIEEGPFYACACRWTPPMSPAPTAAPRSTRTATSITRTARLSPACSPRARRPMTSFWP